MVHPHSHTHRPAQPTVRRLTLALVITLSFVLIEALAGWYANSLALLTDAGHNLTDVMALALSWYALRLAARPAHSGKTFGYHRAGVIIALFNSAVLIALTLWIFYEAFQRLLAPPEVESGLLIAVAVMAFAVNLGTALLLRRGSDHDLNLRSAYLHLAGDALSTLGAILAGIGIRLTGWQWLDPLASALIGLLILWNAWGIVHESVDVLLEGTPRGVDMEALVADLRGVAGVRGVHDLHVWSLTPQMRALSAHLLTDDISISAGAAIRRSANEMLHARYGITHTTLQLECINCEPDRLYCELTPHAHPD
ncbi:MAG: cation diffusion facilitator family transporter [Anaerolineales bacterium]|nr:cation diffusion facilitator family transporter [Anaerolineales bacterium]